MRIATRLLLIGLCAWGVALYSNVAPLAQQPGTVTVRPRVAATQPGMPEVKVTVDQSHVPVGAEVNFALTPAQTMSDSRYRVTLFFGDGKRQIVRRTKVSHVYPQAGTYTYSVLVEGEPHPTPTPLPPLPSVNLAASPTTLEPNRTVSFSAQLSRRYPNLKYRFVFGDGSATDWQDDANASHSYHSANTFKAYVDIGVVANGSVRQAGGSGRESIRVTEPVRPASVTLAANPTSVEAGKPVTLTARPDPQASKATYRFEFGDKSATDWQSSPRASHRYSVAGNYSARVEVRLVNRSNVTQSASDAATIAVTEREGKSKVDLKIIPPTVPLGVPVLFQAMPSVANPNNRYRFIFGDGSSPTNWSSEPLETHNYSAAGNYPAFVEIATSTGAPVKASAASSKQQVRITPIGPNPDNRNSNTGNNANANGPPRANTNSRVNSNANANVAGNRNVNTFGQVNGSTNSQIGTNANGNANATANTNGRINGNPGTNANSVSARTSNANADNANSSVSSTTAGTPGPGANGETVDWWKYLIIAAIILFAAYQAFSYLFAPRPTFDPHFDPGDSRVGAGKPLSINLEMDVDPNIRNGEFHVDTQGSSLIKSKRIEP